MNTDSNDPDVSSKLEAAECVALVDDLEDAESVLRRVDRPSYYSRCALLVSLLVLLAILHAAQLRPLTDPTTIASPANMPTVSNTTTVDDDNNVSSTMPDDDDDWVEIVADSGQTYTVTPTAAEQIQSFRAETGLMINMHITHHGGTTFCGRVGSRLGAPSFACLEARNEGIDDDELFTVLSIPWRSRRPWAYNETTDNIAIVRRYFRMISFEYSPFPPTRLSSTNWEHVDLTSILVIRHPLSRMLAHDAWNSQQFPAVVDGTADKETWMKFARHSINTDNFALHVLSDPTCCNGSSTDPKYLEQAKELVSRFTFVLDIDCLNDGMLALADVLGFADLLDGTHRKADRDLPVNTQMPDKVYKYLSEKNRFDIELYEFAKKRSLVKCSLGPLEDHRTPGEGAAATDSVDSRPLSDKPLNISALNATILNETPQEMAPSHAISNGLTSDEGTVMIESSSGLLYNVTATAARQIDNYRDGQSLIINIHITHHAGTTICRVIGHAKGTDGAPAFVCMGVRDEDNVTIDNFPVDRPWQTNDTERKISLVRPFFHYLGWEFSHAPKVPLADTEWESPHLVSILVMRDPISRLLAGDGLVARTWPDLAGPIATEEHWWEYANHSHTNNYALAILAGDGCCNGENTDPKHLAAAQQLVLRQTFVLDIECLHEGLTALADILGLDIDLRELRELVPNHQHPPNSERIPYPEVYEYLLRRNHLDMELYQWSKSISLVDCATLDQ